LHVPIPKHEIAAAKEAAKYLGKGIYEEFPWVEGGQPVVKDLSELLLNRTWRPTLSVTGADGFPAMQNAGNVLRTHTTFMLSVRLPPILDAGEAAKALTALLELNPPYGAQVKCEVHKAMSGWAAPKMDDWLATSVNTASNSFFGKPVCYSGEGGSIPFMGMLGKMFPKAQFVITGVLGPKSNAHGPNEFLQIPVAKRVTCCVGAIVNDHYQHFCADKNKKQKTEE